MEIFFTLLLCLIFLVVIIGGEIYLEMDKHKARAIVYVKNMKEHLDAWVSLTAEMANSTGTGVADQLRELADKYEGFRKYKDTLSKITIVNAMAKLSEPLAMRAEAGQLLSERADAASGLEPLRAEYNKCVIKLNGRLAKKIPAAVGKLFRMSRLEELSDLSNA